MLTEGNSKGLRLVQAKQAELAAQRAAHARAQAALETKVLRFGAQEPPAAGSQQARSPERGADEFCSQESPRPPRKADPAEPSTEPQRKRKRRLDLD